MSTINYLSNHFFQGEMNCQGELLLYLAQKTRLFDVLESSTIKIAEEFGLSQQTISRKLTELSKQGIIEKKTSPKGIKIMMGKAGIKLLNQKKQILISLFEEKNFLKGQITSGLGEGKYYVRKYKQKIKDKFGFNPYEGTLNLNVKREDLNRFLLGFKKIVIPSFSTKERSFGEVVGYKIKIGKVVGAIVIPKRTRHNKNVVEIIAPVYLKGKFNLKNGDELTCRR